MDDAQPDPLRPFTAAMLAAFVIASLGVVVRTLDSHCLLPIQVPSMSHWLPSSGGSSPTPLDE